MLIATNPNTSHYYNGADIICLPLGKPYSPKDDAEREALLKCKGIIEVEPEEKPAPPSPTKQHKWKSTK